jgi:outer membrane protein assembly factor BamE (lipoprotein component of BamABCDE complex)
MTKIVTIVFVSVFMSGCMTNAQHREAEQNNSLDQLTVGKVQREIKKGMSSAEVAQVLGSPNILSTDKDNNEVWIYDKVSTNTASSNSSSGASILILSGNKSSAASSSSQKTLTIIIKFDKNNKVKNFSYRRSSF